MRACSVLFVLAACGSDPRPPPIAPIAAPSPDAAVATTTPPPAIDAAIAPPEPAVDGAALYVEKACNACHSIDGTAKIGSSMKGLWGTTITLTDGTEVVVDEPFVRASILDPAAQLRAGFPPTMPSYRDVLTDAEVDALVGYIESLR